MKKILVVDDELDIVEIVKYNLTKEGYNVTSSTDSTSVLSLMKTNIPDLVLLDLMMPKMDGIELCEEIRKNPQFENVIVCFLSARGEDFSQIAALDAGGDDYLVKPIKPQLLISRVNALFRRKNIYKNEVAKDGKIVIDRDRYLIVLQDKEIQLPKKEFELLALLSSKPGTVFNRDKILSSVWGNDIVVGDRTIDVHIRKLREKIGEDFIKTVKGIGYKYVDL